MLFITIMPMKLVDEGAYGIGFGTILYVITSIAAVVFAIRLFIDKRRAKKAAKAAAAAQQ